MAVSPLEEYVLLLRISAEFLPWLVGDFAD